MAKATKTGRAPVKYRYLRRVMRESDICGQDLAKVLSVTPETLSRKLNGRIPWVGWEMHAVMEYLGIEPVHMYEAFPPDGNDVDPLEQQTAQKYLAKANLTAVSTPLIEILTHVVEQIAAPPPQ